MEIFIDKNLLHLQNILFDLDNYKFDNDIVRLLDKLMLLVNDKIYKNFDFSKYDDYILNSQDLVFKFYANKK